MKGWHPPHPAFFVKKEIYTRLGSFRTDMSMAADFEFMLRILEKERTKAVYLDEVLVKMRMGGVSNRGLGKVIRKSREDLLIMRSHQLPFPLFSLLSKNFSKISQFFRN